MTPEERGLIEKTLDTFGKKLFRLVFAIEGIDIGESFARGYLLGVSFLELAIIRIYSGEDISEEDVKEIVDIVERRIQDVLFEH